MKIDSMIWRENFFEILSETVKEYYKKVHNKEIEFEYAKQSNLEPVIINDKFSFICRPKAPKGLKQFLLAEYNIRNNKIKYIIGKICVYLVCAYPVLGKCRTAFLTKGIMKKNVFISPQNRSVRFFDYDSMTVDCIVKKGFSNRYFYNQKEFRRKNNYEFMVPLIEFGDDWFREPILKGHALARTTNEQMYKKGIEETIVAIKQLRDDTLQEIRSDDYLKELRNKIDKLLIKARDRKKISDFNFLCKVIDVACNTIQKYPMTIPTVMSHGDLQSGNIWIDENGKTLIYDWETVERRSLWYDAAVLNYSLRRVYGWKELCKTSDAQHILCCDCVERNAEDIYVIKNIVLIEDLIFYLEDMVELPKDWGSDIFNKFLKCIKGLVDEQLRIPRTCINEENI